MPAPTITLNTGAEIPLIGLGTWQSNPGEVAEAVRYALKEAGYRHIDCAWAYGNEREVGEGIRASGIPRSEIFITSKIWSVHHRTPDKGLEEILTNLGTEYVDLLLLHWPVPLNPNGNHPKFPTRPDGSRDIDEDRKLVDTWKDMEALYKSGKAKAIGVSNFSQLKLEEILPHAEVTPAVDQLELHPYNPSKNLIAFLKSHKIVPQAYSPLGSTDSPLLTEETVIAIAKKHGVDSANVLISWHVSKGIVALPKSVTPSRIVSNMKIVDLEDGDIAKLDNLASEGGKQRRFITPPWGFVVGFEDWYEAERQKPAGVV